MRQLNECNPVKFAGAGLLATSFLLLASNAFAGTTLTFSESVPAQHIAQVCIDLNGDGEEGYADLDGDGIAETNECFGSTVGQDTPPVATFSLTLAHDEGGGVGDTFGVAQNPKCTDGFGRNFKISTATSAKVTLALIVNGVDLIPLPLKTIKAGTSETPLNNDRQTGFCIR